MESIDNIIIEDKAIIKKLKETGIGLDITQGYHGNIIKKVDKNLQSTLKSETLESGDIIFQVNGIYTGYQLNLKTITGFDVNAPENAKVNIKILRIKNDKNDGKNNIIKYINTDLKISNAKCVPAISINEIIGGQIIKINNKDVTNNIQEILTTSGNMVTIEIETFNKNNIKLEINRDHKWQQIGIEVHNRKCIPMFKEYKIEVGQIQMIHTSSWQLPNRVTKVKDPSVSENIKDLNNKLIYSVNDKVINNGIFAIDEIRKVINTDPPYIRLEYIDISQYQPIENYKTYKELLTNIQEKKVNNMGANYQADVSGLSAAEESQKAAKDTNTPMQAMADVAARAKAEEAKAKAEAERKAAEEAKTEAERKAAEAESKKEREELKEGLKVGDGNKPTKEGPGRQVSKWRQNQLKNKELDPAKKNGAKAKVVKAEAAEDARVSLAGAAEDARVSLAGAAEDAKTATGKGARLSLTAAAKDDNRNIALSMLNKLELSERDDVAGDVEAAEAAEVAKTTTGEGARVSLTAAAKDDNRNIALSMLKKIEAGGRKSRKSKKSRKYKTKYK